MRRGENSNRLKLGLQQNQNNHELQGGLLGRELGRGDAILALLARYFWFTRRLATTKKNDPRAYSDDDQIGLGNAAPG
jgi:hypothetical protein